MATKPFNAAEIRDALEGELLDIIHKDAEAIVRAVVLSTPVGNIALWQSPPPAGYKPGKHRANWQVTFGNASIRVLEIRDTTGGATIARAFQKIRAYKRLGLRLFLSNNAPAIVRLNQGWSTQAPAGFVEQAVAIARARSSQADVKELP